MLECIMKILIRVQAGEYDLEKDLKRVFDEHTWMIRKKKSSKPESRVLH